MVAEAVLPLPASVEVTALVVLLCVPVAVAVTSIEKVHEVFAARIAFVRLMLLDAASAAMVPAPQLPVKSLGVETVSPVGRVSVKPIPLSERVALGFDRLKVRDVLPFKATVAAPNVMVRVGARFVGGGGGEELPEPPPQATFHRSPVIERRIRTALRKTAGLSNAIFGFLYGSSSGSSSALVSTAVFICR
jgi:hypothetical protein